MQEPLFGKKPNTEDIHQKTLNWFMRKQLENAALVKGAFIKPFQDNPDAPQADPDTPYDPLDGQSPARAAGRYIAEHNDDWENEEAVAIMQGLLKQICGY